MASFTPFLKNLNNQRPLLPHARWGVIAGLILLLAACSDNPSDSSSNRYTMSLGEVSGVLEPGGLRLRSNLSWRISPALIEALQRGIPLHLAVTAEADPLAGQKQVAEQIWEIGYLPLTRTYSLRKVDSDEQETFVRLRHLQAKLSQIDITIPVEQGIATPAGARLRAGLRTSLLPSPMRLPALLSSDWRLGTDWQRWPEDAPA